VGIVFEVRSIYEVSGLRGAWQLIERTLDRPYTKDYDAIPGESPIEWPRRFDVSGWSMLVARVGDERAGGLVLVFDRPGIAEIRDMRVSANHRRRGIGTALFAAAERLARKRSCSGLEVETQNVNVAARDFYARSGCMLTQVEPFAYPELPDEVRLVWRKDLITT
jgi:GNAT superfamily N-acetyltransferase